MENLPFKAITTETYELELIQTINHLYYSPILMKISHIAVVIKGRGIKHSCCQEAWPRLGESLTAIQ